MQAPQAKQWYEKAFVTVCFDCKHDKETPLDVFATKCSKDERIVKNYIGAFKFSLAAFCLVEATCL
jgi:hypothetical protein